MFYFHVCQVAIFSNRPHLEATQITIKDAVLLIIESRAYTGLINVMPNLKWRPEQIGVDGF